MGLLEPFLLFGAFDRKMRPIFLFDRPSFLLKQDKEGRQTAKVTVKLTLTHNLINIINILKYLVDFLIIS